MAVVEFILKNTLKKLIENFDEEKAVSILKTFDPSTLILEAAEINKDEKLTEEEKGDKMSELFSKVYPQQYHDEEGHSDEELEQMENDLGYYQTIISVLMTIATEM